jgi:hypothetical protein
VCDVGILFEGNSNRISVVVYARNLNLLIETVDAVKRTEIHFRLAMEKVPVETNIGQFKVIA